jgi:biopolymer transport protein ExbB
VAILLVLLRIGILLIAGLGTDRLLGRLRPLLQARNLEEARRVVGRSWGSSGRVLQATLAYANADREIQEDAVTEAVLKESPRIERFGAAITVFAAVAPLLGLLGTVTGMMTTFDVITEHGTGDPKLLAGGISEALITTKYGLIVAIPTLLMGTLLRGWAEAIQVNMERAALHVITRWNGEPGVEQARDPATPEGASASVSRTAMAPVSRTTAPSLAEEPS